MTDRVYQMDLDYRYVDFASEQKFMRAIDWCEDQGWEDYVLGGSGIYFSDHYHATLCILRWSS